MFDDTFELKDVKQAVGWGAGRTRMGVLKDNEAEREGDREGERERGREGERERGREGERERGWKGRGRWTFV